MENKFEREVISRLTKIETKIDGIKKIEENAIEALHLSKQNQKDISEIKDNSTWLWRTIVGIIIAYVWALITSIRGGM